MWAAVQTCVVAAAQYIPATNCQLPVAILARQLYPVSWLLYCWGITGSSAPLEDHTAPPSRSD